MRSSQTGATLVELVITIVIISVAIAGVVGAFSLIAGRSADPLNQTRNKVDQGKMKKGNQVEKR